VAQKPRTLLGRILETPDLARVVQGLEPSVLHRLVRQCGLEDSGPIIALATTEQLMRIFDHDLWSSETAGEEEQFDADRFGLWLEVLAEAGAEVAAGKIAEMDFDFVTAALSRHVLVLDLRSIAIEQAAIRAVADLDAMDDLAVALDEQAIEDGLSGEIGGFRVVARRGESWDALMAVLTSLDANRHAFFGRLMSRCAAISTEYIEDNGGLFEVMTAQEQVLSDVAAGREERREQEGYVTPPLAAAFLDLARHPVGSDGAPPPCDHVTAGYFRKIDQRERAGSGEPAPRRDDTPAASTEHQVHRFLETLQDAGVLPRSKRPLLGTGSSGPGDRLSRIRGFLLHAQEADAAVHARREAELGYLANVLIAGCSFQSRRFRAVEAADAVLAVCNLGLENWPRHWPAVEESEPDLVTVFRMGWSVLHERVCLDAARRLVETLRDVTSDDPEVQTQLTELSQRMGSQLKAGTPWRERDNLDVLAILDQPSWATLLGLLDECPVVPRGDRSAGPRPLRVTTEFEFISENRQVAWARDFVESLPDRLVG